MNEIESETSSRDGNQSIPEVTGHGFSRAPSRNLKGKEVGETRIPVLDLNSLPFSSMIIGGKGSCACDPDKHYHLDFLDFNQMDRSIFGDFGVEICFSHYNVFDEYLPRLLTGDGKRIKFLEIPDANTLNSVLYRGTHWYRSFWTRKKSETAKPQITVRRILEIGTGRVGKGDNFGALLQQQCDPVGLKRLLNALINTDGVLQTLVLVWSETSIPKFSDWNYVDSVIRSLVMNFIQDITDEGKEGYKTLYSKVKDARSYMKLCFGQNRVMEVEGVENLFYFKDILPLLNVETETRRDVQNIAVLVQKRSTGMPTPLMRLEAYKKYYEITQKRDKPLSDLERTLLEESTRSIWDDCLGEGEDFLKVLARCQRNEKISLSTSADLLHRKLDGGKLLSANRILHECLPQRVFNLETGEPLNQFVTRESILAGDDSAGQALFFHAFEVFLKCRKEGIETNPLLFTVKPVAVGDQGKYRIATASHPLHAFLLQPIAQLFKSAFLKIPSTKAGMEKQYQMWEFYKRIKPDMVQRVKEKNNLIDRENFFYCEDWEKATDETIRESAAIIFRETGKKLGVPTTLLELGIWALVSPRINVLNPREHIPKEYCPPQFVSYHGILQGDPVTKNILHLIHIVSRRASLTLLNSLAEKSTFFAPVDQKHGIRGRLPTKYTKRDPRIYGGNAGWVASRKENQEELLDDLTGTVKGNLSYAAKGIDPVTQELEFKEKVMDYLLNFFGKKGNPNMKFNPSELLFVQKRIDE